LRARFRDLLRAHGAPRSAAFGALESRVLDALHRRGACRVRDLAPDFPAVAYTTLMTTLDRLHRKGYLEREKSGRAFLYRAPWSREDLEARAAGQTLRGLFERDPRAARPALSHFLDAVDPEDEGLLDELEQLVRRRRERRRKRP
jgi:predicted transcriptional regulator